jgi:type II secretory pathway component PulJ
MTTSRARHAQRRGYSLVEMVLVIGSLSIILSLCGMLLHTLLRLDRSGRESLTAASALNRLARQFRNDVRAADSASPRRDGFELSRPGGPRVVYHPEGNRLVREEIDGNGNGDGDRGAVRRREAYSIGRYGRAAFRVDGRRVRLMFEPGEGPAARTRPSPEIEARLGKDRDTPAPVETPK